MLKIRNPILTFEIVPNAVFWSSKTYFDFQIGQKSYLDIRNGVEYRMLTIKILFWHSYWGRMSYFSFKILFWHSNLGQLSYFYIWNPILTFEIWPNIVFWHSNWGGISYFDIQNPILTFEIGPNIVFHHSKSYWNRAPYRILTFRILFDIRNLAEYCILTFKTLFWHSNWGRISHFDILNHILTFKQQPNIAFWHSKSYFDIRTGAEYRILTFKILFWHSNRDQIAYFDIQNHIFSHSK